MKNPLTPNDGSAFRAPSPLNRRPSGYVPRSREDALPKVCYRCRVLKVVSLGTVERVPGRYHDRRFVCFTCFDKRSSSRHGHRHRQHQPSPLERRACKALVECGVQFDQEFPLGKFFFDFAVPSLRLLIEVDGRSHHWSPRRRRCDRVKTQLAERDGWRVVRVTSFDVEGQVRCFVDRRRAELGQEQS